jgi:hypothetical protein
MFICLTLLVYMLGVVGLYARESCDLCFLQLGLLFWYHIRTCDWPYKLLSMKIFMFIIRWSSLICMKCWIIEHTNYGVCKLRVNMMVRTNLYEWPLYLIWSFVTSLLLQVVLLRILYDFVSKQSCTNAKFTFIWWTSIIYMTANIAFTVKFYIMDSLCCMTYT